jgi:hypothetical protein
MFPVIGHPGILDLYCISQTLGQVPLMGPKEVVNNAKIIKFV